MRSDLLVYLAGPLTATGYRTVEDHVASAVRVFLDCLGRGIPAYCPHLAGAFPSAWAIPWEVWMAYDLVMLDRCTHLLLLPGWEDSRGAVVERGHAIATGKPVVESVEELLDVTARAWGV